MPEDFAQDTLDSSRVTIGLLKIAKDSSLTISGANGIFSVGNGVWLRTARFLIESPDSSIILEDGVNFTGSIFLKGNGPNHVRIGKGSTCGQVNIICSEGSKITIGEDCMLAWAIELRSTDSHAIFDLDSGERINGAADIEVSDHVWIAAKSHVLKGTSIARGCVVGMGSVLTSQFEEADCVIVGNPARVVRRRVRWERPLLG